MSFVFSEELLSAYLDGELSPEEIEQVERFLEDNPGSQNRLEDLKDASEALKLLPRIAAPADFSSQLIAALDSRQPASLPIPRQNRSRSRWARWARWARWSRYTVSACCLILATVFVVQFVLPTSSPEHMVADRGLEMDSLNLKASALGEGAATFDEMEGFGEQEGSEAAEFADMGIASNWNLNLEMAAVPTVTFLDRETITQRLSSLGQVPVTGEQLSLLTDSDEAPLLVDFTVVDVEKSLSELRLLLKQHAVTPVVMQESVDESSRHASGGLVAVVIELEQPDLEQVLQQVSAVDARLYSPLLTMSSSMDGVGEAFGIQDSYDLSDQATSPEAEVRGLNEFTESLTAETQQFESGQPKSFTMNQAVDRVTEQNFRFDLSEVDRLRATAARHYQAQLSTKTIDHPALPADAARPPSPLPPTRRRTATVADQESSAIRREQKMTRSLPSAAALEPAAAPESPAVETNRFSTKEETLSEAPVSAGAATLGRDPQARQPKRASRVQAVVLLRQEAPE